MSSNIRTATTGFVIWVLTSAGGLSYLLWSSVSVDTLRTRLGFTYYPDRYWAAGLPAVFVALVYVYFVTYRAHAMRNTKPLCDTHVLTDSAARGARAELGSLDDDVAARPGDSVPPISDINAATMSRVLYHVWE